MMYTTLNQIRGRRPCQSGWERLLSYLGKTKADDEPLLISTILASNGLDDALWCLRALPLQYDPQVRLLVCDLVTPALAQVPAGEGRPRQALETARRYARGEATEIELKAARWSVDYAVRGAYPLAAMCARDAAWWATTLDHARDVALDAAWEARTAAGWGARLHSDAGQNTAARMAAKAEQERIFRQWLARMEEKE